MTFEDAYRAHRPALAAYLKRRLRGSEIDPDDAMQESLLQIWRLWDRTGEIKNLRAWMLGVSRRVVSHMQRAGKFRPVTVEMTRDDEPIGDGGIEHIVLFNQVVAVIGKTVRGAAQRDVLFGLASGENAREIAERTGRSIAAVNMALTLGRRNIQWLTG